MEKLLELMDQLPPELSEEGTTGRDLIDSIIGEAKAEVAREIFLEIERDSNRDDKDGWLDYTGNWLDLKRRYGG